MYFVMKNLNQLTADFKTLLSIKQAKCFLNNL